MGMIWKAEEKGKDGGVKEGDDKGKGKGEDVGMEGGRGLRKGVVLT